MGDPMLYGAMNYPVWPVLQEMEAISELGFDYVELAMDPPEVMMPSAAAGNPRISASHRTTRSSTWIAAWSPPQQLLFSAAAR